MSILIKGMEMPQDGCHHMICIYADGTVSTGGRKYTAVPVPPHGRLIDADALETHECYDGEWEEVVYKDDIDAAPTIIDAEEG